MAEALKVLAQSAPAAATNTDILTVGAGKSIVGSTLVICNRGGTATTYRVAARPAGAALANAHYLFYDVAIPANSTHAITIGLTLAATDVLTVLASAAQLSFTLFGTEVS